MDAQLRQTHAARSGLELDQADPRGSLTGPTCYELQAPPSGKTEMKDGEGGLWIRRRELPIARGNSGTIDLIEQRVKRSAKTTAIVLPAAMARVTSYVDGGEALGTRDSLHLPGTVARRKPARVATQEPGPVDCLRRGDNPRSSQQGRHSLKLKNAAVLDTPVVQPGHWRPGDHLLTAPLPTRRSVIGERRVVAVADPQTPVVRLGSGSLVASLPRRRRRELSLSHRTSPPRFPYGNTLPRAANGSLPMTRGWVRAGSSPVLTACMPHRKVQITAELGNRGRAESRGESRSPPNR